MVDRRDMSFKRLILDIETRPPAVYTWRLFDATIGIDQIIEPGGTICFAAKWYGEKRMMFHSDHHDGHDEMILRAHELMSEADAIIHYNGASFDVKHLNGEIAVAGLIPPAPHKNIDLLSVVRRNFRYDSHKLDFVAQRLGVGSKLKHTGFSLWKECLAGDEKAWRLMRRYNCNDVALTEKVYDRLLPWITTHPNMALYVDFDNPVCPNCGSLDLQKRGTTMVGLGEYQRYQCNGCGKWSRSGKSIRRVDLRGAS